MTIQGANLRNGQATGTGTLGVVLAQSGNFDVANSGASLNISALVSGAFTMTKTGAGTLTLSGANTFTGLTIAQGTVSVPTVANVNVAQPLGKVSGAITVGGAISRGTVEYTGATASTTQQFAMVRAAAPSRLTTPRRR